MVDGDSSVYDGKKGVESCDYRCVETRMQYACIHDVMLGMSCSGDGIC